VRKPGQILWHITDCEYARDKQLGEQPTRSKNMTHSEYSHPEYSQDPNWSRVDIVNISGTSEQLEEITRLLEGLETSPVYLPVAGVHSVHVYVHREYGEDASEVRKAKQALESAGYEVD
jgi:hypothetical protein